MAAPSRSTYDVVIVGAGVIGLACAWRAAQAGLGVLVVERDEPGAGASGVAAGMLAAVTEAQFGEVALLELNLASAQLWEAFAAELAERSGLVSGYEASGALVAAIDRDDAEELGRLHSFQRSLGLATEWLGPRECRRLEPRLSPRIAGGILVPADHHVEPRALVRALARALLRAGGEIAEHFGDASIESNGGRVSGVRGEDGSAVATERVVVAAGCWSGSIEGVAPDQLAPVRPVKGQVLRLAGRSGRTPATRLIRTPRCYIVSRAGGEVVVGATQEEAGFDTRVTAGGISHLLESAAEVLPDIRELEFVEAAARLRPGTPDNGPLIGRAGIEGLIWATGHYRNGVLLAPITAAAIAGCLCGSQPPPPVAPFTPERFASGRRLAGSYA